MPQDVYRPVTTRIAKATGMPVLAFDYRLSPEFKYPAQLDDAVQAFEWIARNGPDGPSDASAIFIMGDSAGGGLALALALQLRDSPVHGAVARESEGGLSLGLKYVLGQTAGRGAHQAQRCDALDQTSWLARLPPFQTSRKHNHPEVCAKPSSKAWGRTLAQSYRTSVDDVFDSKLEAPSIFRPQYALPQLRLEADTEEHQHQAESVVRRKP